MLIYPRSSMRAGRSHFFDVIGFFPVLDYARYTEADCDKLRRSGGSKRTRATYPCSSRHFLTDVGLVQGGVARGSGASAIDGPVDILRLPCEYIRDIVKTRNTAKSAEMLQ